MARESGLPVHTVEAVPRNFGFSRARFWPNRNVTTELGDSRTFLRDLVVRHANENTPAFAYLDAHWYDDLPLREECEILLTSSRPWVLMIDDFAVPDDTGYGYDDYGVDKNLTPEYLAPIAHLHNGLLFPRLPSEEETGARRGSAVLTNSADIMPQLQALGSLRVLTESAIPSA